MGHGFHGYVTNNQRVYIYIYIYRTCDIPHIIYIYYIYNWRIKWYNMATYIHL